MQLLYRLGTFLAAWLGSAIALFLVLPLGLVVVEWIIFPLALAIAALLAALGAGWAGTLLARDKTRTKLLPVAGAAEVTAVVILIILFAIAALRATVLGPLIVPAVICSLILALSASIATWRFRSPRQGLGSELKLTAALLLLAVISVPITIFLASLFGLAGA